MAVVVAGVVIFLLVVSIACWLLLFPEALER
ncbi:M15 family peptidase, partial [Xanthomonas oryzae pv. oryzae]